MRAGVVFQRRSKLFPPVPFIQYSQVTVIIASLAKPVAHSCIESPQQCILVRAGHGSTGTLSLVWVGIPRPPQLLLRSQGVTKPRTPAQPRSVCSPGVGRCCTETFRGVTGRVTRRWCGSSPSGLVPSDAKGNSMSSHKFFVSSLGC